MLNKTFCAYSTYILAFLVIGGSLLFVPGYADCETLGIKDSQGNFVPKVKVTVGARQVTIEKTDHQEKFNAFSIVLNPKNANLVRDVGLISIEWIDALGKAGKPVVFAGPLYNASTRTFQDSLVKSVGIKLIDKSTKGLFGGKPVADLFSIHVDDEVLLSAETVTESDRTVQLGAGKDVTLNIDKTSLNFNENNIKAGEWLNVENRSGTDQVLGVELPQKTLLTFRTILRKPESDGKGKIPEENWDRFSLPADAAISICVIPKAVSTALNQLDGKEITIKVYQGAKVDTRRIPIKISSDLKAAGRIETAPETQKTSAEPERVERPTRSEPSPTTLPKRELPQKTGVWLWVLQGLNLLLLAGLGGFSVFFVLPKIQLLEDRLAKTEMFIHGSRQSIREEMDQIKEEVLRQCLEKPEGE
jgi:hypothetical protein